jgi:hypothetical protein
MQQTQSLHQLDGSSKIAFVADVNSWLAQHSKEGGNAMGSIEVQDETARAGWLDTLGISALLIQLQDLSTLLSAVSSQYLFELMLAVVLAAFYLFS